MARFAHSAVTVTASLMLFGCAAPRPAADAEPRPATQVPATIAPEPPPSAPPAGAPVPAPVAPAATRATPPPSSSSSSASPGTPSSRPLPTPGATTGAAQPKPAAPAPVQATKPAAAEAPKTPTLDLGSLEQRLKDTKAIGVFTKLSLKNQVDDLLGELRAFHKGAAKTPAAALRQKYDTLIMKVLTLLQNGDPQLAAAIASSREALWGILMDPQKFSQI